MFPIERNYITPSDYSRINLKDSADEIIKKIKKRQSFLNQPTYKSGFQDFRVEVFEC